MIEKMSATKAWKRIQEDKNTDVLVDVRTGPEFRELHAENAKHLPLDRIDKDSVSEIQKDQKANVFLFCKSGGRATKAAEKLEKEGVQNLVVIEGGTDAWASENLPVVHGEKSVSLERQVRIVVGGLNMIAAVLALTIHPAFAGLCLFFGAGLLFAGITDWCGMGMVLARMPWNRA